MVIFADCHIILNDYTEGRFCDGLPFGKSKPNDLVILKGLVKALHNVEYRRHTKTIIIMADDVMEMMTNIQLSGQINGTIYPIEDRYIE